MMRATELKQSDLPASEEKQETYHIFNYMKDHTAFFVACVSGFVAAVSFILSLATFAYEQLQFRVWDVDIQLVDFSVGGKSYYFILSNLIYCIAFTLLVDKFEQLFQRYFHDTSPIIYVKELEKSISKYNRIQKREICRLRWELKWKKLFSEDKLDARKKLIRLDVLSQNIDNINFQQTKVKKSICRIRLELVRSLLVGLFLTAIFLLLPLVLFVFCLSGELVPQAIIIIWLLLFGLMCFLAAGAVKLKEPAYRHKRIKQKAKAVAQQQIFSNASAIEEYQVPNLSSETQKHFFCDKNLKDLSYTFLAGFLSLLLIMILSGTEAKERKTFWMYADKEQLYVIVYQDASSCILKEANVEKDILTVNTSNQLIADSKGINTYKETFSKVIRIAE